MKMDALKIIVILTILVVVASVCYQIFFTPTFSDIRINYIAPSSQASQQALQSQEDDVSSSFAQQLVHLNTATQEELESLPGIGPVTAKKILEYREQNGPFTSIEQLDEVKGIGEKTIEKIRPYLTLD